MTSNSKGKGASASKTSATWLRRTFTSYLADERLAYRYTNEENGRAPFGTIKARMGATHLSRAT
jgi:hypothetical protein